MFKLYWPYNLPLILSRRCFVRMHWKQMPELAEGDNLPTKLGPGMLHDGSCHKRSETYLTTRSRCHAGFPATHAIEKPTQFSENVCPLAFFFHIPVLMSVLPHPPELWGFQRYFRCSVH